MPSPSSQSQQPKPYAICISGQLRNWKQLHHSLQTIIDSIPCDIFVSTWDRAGKTTAYERLFPNSYLANMLMDRDADGQWQYDPGFSTKYPNLSELLFEQALITEDAMRQYLNAHRVEIETFPSDFGETRTLHGLTYPKIFLETMQPRYVSSLPMFYKIWAADQLRQKHEEERGLAYEKVIRTRSDIFINDPEEVVRFILEGEIEDKTVYTPRDERENFIQDMFAIGDSESMKMYTSLWESLPDYWDVNKFPEYGLNRRAAEPLLHMHYELKGINSRGTLPGCFVNLAVDRFTHAEIQKPLTNDLLRRSKATDREKMSLTYLNDVLTVERIEKTPPDKLGELLPGINSFAATHFHDLAPANFSFAKYYEKAGQKDLAKEYFRRAYEYYRDDWPEAAIDYARMCFNDGDLANAISALSFTLVKFPKHYFCWRNLGIYYREMGQLELSREYLEQAYIVSAGRIQSIIREREKTRDLLEKRSN